MGEVSFPTTADGITNEWLSQALGLQVAGFETKFLEGGVLADAFKLHSIRYKGGASGPGSIVVKVPNAVPERAEMAVMSNAYAKEANFFRELAPKVPVHSPKVYACHTDGTPECRAFIIVMEDLTAHSKVFDQVDDPPDVPFARKVAMEAARLHAAFWESETLQLPWVGRPDKRYVFSLDALCASVQATIDPFRALWRQMYGKDVYEGPYRDQLEEFSALLTGPRSREIHERIYDVLSSRPQTLLHGDMRADNVFRTIGKGADEATLTFIDWQVMHAGPPGPEFTQAWFNSLEPDVRRHDRDILREYHTELVRLQPKAAAYTYDMLVEDYALAMCFWWTAIVTLGVGTIPIFDRPEGARMKELWGKGLGRVTTAMIELDCMARIKAL